jgi:uncharacterized protein
MPKEQIPNGPAKLPPSVVQACWAGNAQWIEMFLDEGGSPNAIDDHGLTLFSRACVSEHVHVVQKIIEHKNFDRKACLERVSCGKTPLMWAAWHGKKQVAQLLTQQKASLEAHDENGCTALMLAAKENELECLEVLLIAGANIFARNKTGYTIRRYAQRDKNADVIALLNRYQKKRRDEKKQKKPVEKEGYEFMQPLNADELKELEKQNAPAVWDWCVFQ